MSIRWCSSSRSLPAFTLAWYSAIGPSGLYSESLYSAMVACPLLSCVAPICMRGVFLIVRNGNWRPAPAMQSTHSVRRCCCAKNPNRLVRARLCSALTASLDAIAGCVSCCFDPWKVCAPIGSQLLVVSQSCGKVRSSWLKALSSICWLELVCRPRRTRQDVHKS